MKHITSALIVTLVGAPVAGADVSLDPASDRASLLLDGLTMRTVDALAQDSLAVAEFAQGGTWWWSVGAGGQLGGRRLDSAVTGNVQFHYFLVDNFEIGLEFSGHFFDQPTGGDAIGVGFNPNFRWHFFKRDRFTVFVDGGAGILGTTDEVPDRGTEFNFTPRAGLGLTWQPGEGAMRIMFGARWQHVSNARIDGSERNPGMDNAMVHLSVMFPF